MHKFVWLTLSRRERLCRKAAVDHMHASTIKHCFSFSTSAQPLIKRHFLPDRLLELLSTATQTATCRRDATCAAVLEKHLCNFKMLEQLRMLQCSLANMPTLHTTGSMSFTDCAAMASEQAGASCSLLVGFRVCTLLLVGNRHHSQNLTS